MRLRAECRMHRPCGNTAVVLRCRKHIPYLNNGVNRITAGTSRPCRRRRGTIHRVFGMQAAPHAMPCGNSSARGARLMRVL